MKKKVIGGIAVCFLACFVGGVCFTQTTEKASASTVEKTVLSESFNSENLSNDWTVSQAKIHTYYNAMRFNGGYYWHGAVCLNEYLKDDYNKFVMEVQLSDYAFDSWFAFAFGGEKTTTAFHEYDGFLDMKTNNVALVYSEENYDHSRMQTTNGINAFEKMRERTKIEIIFDETQDNRYDCTLSYTFADGSNLDFSWENVRINEQNSYFALNGSKMVLDILDFKIENRDGENLFHDDFSQNTMTYETDDPSKGNWHITGGYGERELFIGQIGVLDISQKDASAVYKNPLVNPVKTNEAHRFTWLTCIDSLCVGETIGIGLGLKDTSSAVDEKIFIGITALDEDTGAFVLYKDGKLKKTAGRFSLNTMQIGTGVYLPTEVVLTYDYSVKINLGTTTCVFENVNYEGYWGFGSICENEQMQSRVYFDDVALHSFNSVYHASADASNSFSGIKETDGIESYYINKNEWFLGPNVEIKENRFAFDDPRDCTVLFSQSGPYSSFGVRKKYDEFIVRFDATLMSDGMNGQAFGLTFNKSSFFTNIENSTGVGFIYNGYDESNIRSMVRGYNCFTQDGAVELEIDQTHFWKDKETRYNFMFIVRNRSVEVYFKEDGEDISKLSLLRAKFTDVDTDGYVSVFGTGGISFGIYNYNITNIGLQTQTESETPVRTDFSSGLNGGLQTTGSLVNGALALENGQTLSLKEEGIYYLSRFKVCEADGVFKVKFSQNNEVIFDGENNRIGFTQPSLPTEYISLPSGRNFAFDSGNTVVELKILRNRVEVGFYAQGESADRLYETVASYTFGELFTLSKWQLIAGGKLIVDEFRAYNLDLNYPAEKTDYSPEHDKVSAWVEKEVDESEKGCGSTLSLTGLPLLGLATGIAFARKKRKGER